MPRVDAKATVRRVATGSRGSPAMTKPRHAERVPLNCEIEFKRHGGARYRVELFDLSADGCCLSPPIRVKAGDSISLRIPDMEAIHGEIAWVRDWKAGVRFDHPFHAAVFDHVVARLNRPSAS
jgi:hypothetical protein